MLCDYELLISKPEVAVISCSGELTRNSGNRLLMVSEELLAKSLQKVVLDFSQLKFISSEGFVILLRIRSRFLHVSIACSNPSIYKILDRIFPQRENLYLLKTREDAIQAILQPRFEE